MSDDQPERPDFSTRWKKGQSGNPGGRAKKTVTIDCDGEEVEINVTDMAKAFTPEAIKTLVTIAVDAKMPAAARVTAATAIIERGWGKAPQMLIGDPEQPISVAGVTLEDVMAARAKVVDEC